MWLGFYYCCCSWSSFSGTNITTVCGHSRSRRGDIISIMFPNTSGPFFKSKALFWCYLQCLEGGTQSGIRVYHLELGVTAELIVQSNFHDGCDNLQLGDESCWRNVLISFIFAVVLPSFWESWHELKVLNPKLHSRCTSSSQKVDYVHLTESVNSRKARGSVVREHAEVFSISEQVNELNTTLAYEANHTPTAVWNRK